LTHRPTIVHCIPSPCPRRLRLLGFPQSRLLYFMPVDKEEKKRLCSSCGELPQNKAHVAKKWYQKLSNQTAARSAGNSCMIALNLIFLLLFVVYTINHLPDLIESYEALYLTIRTENPSTQAPQEPATPQMVYPLGGIKVCAEPPWALPYTGDLLPRLVRTWIASIQNPERT